MIAFNKCPQATVSSWQDEFLLMLPQIEKLLRRHFCRFDANFCEELIEEGVVHCLLAFVRLHEQGRASVATPWTLVFYAAKHVKRGRPAAGRMTGTEPLSRYAQVNNRVSVERLSDKWIEALVEDKRASVPDQVAVKVDFANWFGSLTQRMRGIAKDLAFGLSTSEVARKNGVSAGRISQMRRSLQQSWIAFMKEPVEA
jgi:hypothetical protein